MKVSYDWLKEYFSDLPSPEKLSETLSLHSYEVEGIEDGVLDIDVLPNRSHDSLSYWGVAREVAVLLDQEVNIPNEEPKTDDSEKSANYITLSVEDSKLVPRAMKRVVLDVEVKDSPDWLKEKIKAQGGNPKNNIVDITNLVMWETGQPVHAFDFDKIKKGEITVRGAKKGEKIEILDGEEYELEEGMLVIADPEKALDVAGIKGGANSLITAETKRIVLSICNFHQAKIRNTSQALNLQTDASKRFGNGISPHMTEIAMKRLSYLISEVALGRVLEDILDVYPQEKIRTTGEYKIGFSLNELNHVLGTNMSSKEVENILDRMRKYQGFKYELVNPKEKLLQTIKSLEGAPYKYGASITYDAPRFFDCSSFTAYSYVQAGLSLPRMTADQYLFGTEIDINSLEPGDIIFSKNNSSQTEKIERLNTEQNTLHKETKDFMPGTEIKELDHNGIYLGDGEIAHASGKWDKGKVVIEKLEEAPAFKNMVGARRIIREESERYVVSIPQERLDLRAGPGFMVSGNKEDLIEEIGRIYGFYKLESKAPENFPFDPKPNKTFYYLERIKDILVEEGFSEVMTYTFRNKGKVKLHNALAEDKQFLRESLEDGLKESFELNSKNLPVLERDEIKVFEIGSVFDGGDEHLELAILPEEDLMLQKIEKELGGKINKNLNKCIESLEDINLDSLDTDIISSSTFKSISPYPYVLRDIAFWTEDSSEEEARGVIKENSGDLLKTVKLFDVYEKDGQVSYAFRLAFQSNEKTLSDEEVNKVMEGVYEAVNNKGWKER